MLKTTLAFIVCLGFASTVQAQEPDAAATFVTQLKDAALALYAPDVSDVDRHGKLCDLMESNVNIQFVGNFAAGRFVKQMSQEVQTSFYLAVKAKLVRFFDTAFMRLKDGTVTVNPTSKPAGPARIVTVEVQKENRSPSTVQFYVAPDSEARLRLQDAQMQGFALTAILKNEFANILAEVKSEDPDVKGNALIADMNAKNPACP